MNSDLEQCTESKLGRVHYTHGISCSQVALALRHVMASVGPYRSPLPGRVTSVPYRVAAHTRALAHRVAAFGLVVSQPSHHDIENSVAIQLLPRAFRSCCALCRSVHAAVSLAVSRAVSRRKIRPQPRYDICIVTPPPARPHARAYCRTPLRAAGRVVAHVCRVLGSCRRASWPCRGHPTARLSALCHDTMHYIGTKAGKWAIAHPATSYTFFFTSFFFHLFHLLEDHQIYIYIYIYINFHFPVEQNKFIIFLFFFSSFTL